MIQYIIIVEWKALGITNSSLERLLESNFKCVKLTSQSYIISCLNTPVEIRNFLTDNLPNIDRLFIGELKSSAAWRNMLSENEMIKRLFNNEE